MAETATVAGQNSARKPMAAVVQTVTLGHNSRLTRWQRPGVLVGVGNRATANRVAMMTWPAANSRSETPPTNRRWEEISGRWGKIGAN